MLLKWSIKRRNPCRPEKLVATLTPLRETPIVGYYVSLTYLKPILMLIYSIPNIIEYNSSTSVLEISGSLNLAL